MRRAGICSCSAGRTRGQRGARVCFVLWACRVPVGLRRYRFRARTRTASPRGRGGDLVVVRTVGQCVGRSRYRQARPRRGAASFVCEGRVRSPVPGHPGSRRREPRRYTRRTRDLDSWIVGAHSPRDTSAYHAGLTDGAVGTNINFSHATRTLPYSRKTCATRRSTPVPRSTRMIIYS